jgi:hypothetical protein
MADAEKCKDILDTVKNQEKRISILEKRCHDLESVVITQANKIMMQTKVMKENTKVITKLQKRHFSEKLNAKLETRMKKMIKSIEDKGNEKAVLDSADNFKHNKKGLIRKGMGDLFHFPNHRHVIQFDQLCWSEQ